MLMGLVGCGASATMNNESGSWVDVRYYVGNPPAQENDTWQFVAHGRQQVEPGKTTTYDLTTNPNFRPDGESVIHALYEPTSPSWEAATQYWVEFLTPAPMTVVVTEGEEGLEFSTEKGVIKVVPAETIASDGYDYTTVIEPEDNDGEEAEHEDDTDEADHEEDDDDAEHDAVEKDPAI